MNVSELVEVAEALGRTFEEFLLVHCNIFQLSLHVVSQCSEAELCNQQGVSIMGILFCPMVSKYIFVGVTLHMKGNLSLSTFLPSTILFTATFRPPNSPL